MQLHEYQERAVKHLHANDRAALLLDMGLGKTAVVLRALEPRHLPVLVIAPKRVAEHVWEAEGLKWRRDLNLIVAKGTPAQRRRAIDSGADVTVIGRDNIKDIKAGRYNTIVLDEMSGFKNRSTNRWKLARPICREAQYVWGLTGTPTPNGLMDLWAQLYLLDGGQRLGATLGAYRGRYFRPGRVLPNNVVIEWTLKPGAETAIHRKVADICMSMAAEDYLDMPPFVINKVEVDLPASVAATYDQMRRTLLATLSDTSVITAANAAVVSSKLSQISAGFIYDDQNLLDSTDLHDAKIEALKEIIEGSGSPVLVFYRFKAEARRIAAAIPEAEFLTAPTAVKRWCLGQVPVLLAHPVSAGHGLNLQAGGHTVVWSTLTWSAEEWEQANARLWRQGQEHPVIVHWLSAAGVDEAMRARLLDKVSAQEALLAHLRA